jgi:hypothetical protein
MQHLDNKIAKIIKNQIIKIGKEKVGLPEHCFNTAPCLFNT